MTLYKEKICCLHSQKNVFSNPEKNFLTFKNYVVPITEYVIIMFLKKP